MTAPTGRTRLAAVIGDPIRHSRSPQIFNAAFAATGLDWVYVALEVAEGHVPAALEGMRALGIAGLSVTMPHKTAVADHLDAVDGGELAHEARALRAVNCVANRDGSLVGHNTDGAGFVASLRADAGFDPSGSRCAVLGAGGAARALVLALAGAGAADVAVVNRTRDAAVTAAALAGPVGRVAGPDEPDVVDAADLVVNATPVGMDGSSLPLDPSRLSARQLVVDIVVEPVETPLLREAAARGARTLGGLGMLAHQAAVAFEIWTGRPAPVEAMVEAAGRQ
ncbi:MAG TPA: shikimate dehydrogenase [Acidimicrobiales bacterium]|nr:shikimate dehydrogenase [Acidimicrobiales bacterium]